MALSSNMGTNLEAKFGSIQAYTAGATIYRGATVVLRQTDSKVYPAVSDPSDTYKQVVLGIAMEVATIGQTIRVRQDGKYARKLTGSPAQVVGRLACVYDDETVQLYGVDSCKVVVGRITEWPSTTKVFVNLLDRPSRLANGVND